MEVLKVAFPVPSRVAVPKVVAPFLKVTVPVGVPEDPVTVAVKVTDCPNTLGLPLDDKVVVELTGGTTVYVCPVKAMLFSSTLALLPEKFPVTMSSLPSAFTSPSATLSG